MANSEEKKLLNASEADVQFEKSVEEIANVFLEEEEAQYQGKLEPFEAHAQKVRKEIHENMVMFRDRFLKGYDLLLRELAQQYTGRTETKGEIPPNAIKL